MAEVIFTEKEPQPEEDRLSRVLGKSFSQRNGIRQFIQAEIGETKEEWRERFFAQNEFDFWMPDDGAANPNLGSEGGITLGALIEERKRVEAMNAAERERLGV